MPGIRTIVLRALLRPTPLRRFRRLGQMHDRTHPPALLDHEPPAGRRLKRDLELLTGEPLQEPAHASTISRHHPRALHLARLALQPIGGDLRSMLIKSHYDAHSGPPQAPWFERLHGHAPCLS